MRTSVKNCKRLSLRSIAAVGLCLLTILSVAPIARPKGQAPYAIKGARIVTVTGQTIENGNLVIRDGLITAVGANAPIPADARVIEGAGLTVYPGLIDAYTNLGLPEPQQQQQPQGGRGAGGQAQLIAALAGQQQGDPLAGKRPELLAADEIKPGGAAIENERSVGVTTALVVPRDGIFSGQSALVNLDGASSKEMIIKSPVALHLTFNSARGFGGGGGYPGSLMGVIAYIRQRFYDAQHYQLELARYEREKRGIRRPEPDNSLDALQPIIKRGEPIIFSADSETQIRRAINIADEFNLKMIVAGGTQAQNVAPILKQKNIPVLVSLNFPKPRPGIDDETETLRALRDRAAAPKNPGALAKAGVKFAFYSGGLANPRDIFTSANLAIENGLSKDDALKALTINPAEILGVSDTVGSIEKGKIANLVVTSGDIFNIGKGTQVKYLFIDGEQVDVKKEDAAPARPGGGNRPGGGGNQPGGGITAGGTWTLTVTTGQGPIEVIAVIKQDGDNLTGTTTSPLGNAPISAGKISGNQINFAVSVNAGGDAFTATFRGVIEGNTMKGSVDTPQGPADFTGTRRPQ